MSKTSFLRTFSNRKTLFYEIFKSCLLKIFSSFEIRKTDRLHIIDLHELTNEAQKTIAAKTYSSIFILSSFDTRSKMATQNL